MTRDELVERLSSELGLPRKDVERVVVAMLEIIMDTAKTGGSVSLAGFGQFYAAVRSARAGVNPRNPAQRIEVPAVRIPKFRAGKRFKDQVK